MPVGFLLRVTSAEMKRREIACFKRLTQTTSQLFLTKINQRPKGGKTAVAREEKSESEVTRNVPSAPSDGTPPPRVSVLTVFNVI